MIVEEHILHFVFVPSIVEEQILWFVFVPSIVKEQINSFLFVPLIVEDEYIRFDPKKSSSSSFFMLWSRGIDSKEPIQLSNVV